MNRTMGEVRIVGVDLSENESEMIVGCEKNYMEMKYKLTSTTMTEMQIGNLLNKVLLANGYDWIVLVDMQKGVMTFEIKANTSPNPRMCDITCNNKVYRIKQLQKSDIKEFNVIGGGKTIPNMINDIILDASEVGVMYSLYHANNVIKTIEGTGSALTFTVVSDIGEYMIKGFKDGNEKNMKGSASFTWYSVINHVTLTNFNYAKLPAKGGKGLIVYVSFDDNVYNNTYQNDLMAIASACNEGRVSGWNSGHVLKFNRLDADRLYFALTITPNTLADIRESTLFLNSSGTKGIYVSQLGGGEIIKFNVFGDNFVLLGENFSVGIPGSQLVKYGLYRNNLKIMEEMGDQNQLFFQGLREPGEYTIKAECDGQIIPMNGTVNVRDINVNPPHMIEESHVGEGATIRNISYYDGQGRSVQHVSVGASSGGKDIVTPVVRDPMGREATSYLPFAISGSGAFRVNAVTEQEAFFRELYGSNAMAYTSRRFDNSPEDRVIEQSAPGYSWRLDGGHTTRFSYRKNVEDDKVKRYTLVGTSVKFDSTYWYAGSLAVQMITSPGGNVSLEYRDAQGNIVAKESRLTTGKRVFTYEVQDILGRPRYVIPPIQDSLFTGGTKTLTELSRYCYYTEYDDRGRVYKQYNPGADYAISLYDNRGRVALTQDAEQRKAGKWSFTKYDELDRPVISGFCTGTEEGHREALASQTLFGENRGTALHGYTNVTYPTAITSNDCYLITYYDDYNWAGQAAVAYSSTDAIGDIKSDQMIGRVTGTKTKVLGITTHQWLLSASYFDKKYLSVQSVSQLYPSGIEIVSNTHDFTGQVTRAKVKQTVGSLVTEYNKYFTYDQQGRLLKIEQQITGDITNGRVKIVENTYDEQGRLATRKLHNGGEIQSYQYNVQGNVTNTSSPAFAYTLSYDQVNVTGATACYDGNVNAMTWKNGSGVEKAYIYTYDPMGQLKSASYKEKSGTSWAENPTGKYNTHGLTYDLNGNIKTLQRNSAVGTPLHALKYTYGVTNNGNAVSQITFGNTTSGTYVYDANGNMTTDGRRGVTIVYNELKLPSVISKGDSKISYIYSATGEKLAQQSGSSQTFYRGVMVYNGNSLDYISHPAGVTRKVSRGYVYDYFLTDHLGSTRVVLEAGGSTLVPVQTTEYYPFGLAFSHNNLDKNKHLFSGKEIQDVAFNGEMLGFYDFGSRFYDPLVGRWFCQDPASQLMSPYGYCGNNPVAFVDPNGEFIFGYLFGWFRGLFKGNNPFKEGWNTGVNETKIMLGLFRTGGKQNILQKGWELLSRFTWQAPQTLIGFGYSNYLNYASRVTVDYYGGTTTLSTSMMDNAVTLGNYIAGNQELEADPSNSLFQHEYGHYLQSKTYGPAYLTSFAIPSGLSVARGNDHDYFLVEQDANARAIKYFNKRGVLDWDFKENLIGNDRYKWKMSNIYKDGSTREFTDEFNSMLKAVKLKPTLGDYGTPFINPIGLYLLSNMNYNHYGNVNWSTANNKGNVSIPRVSTGIRR